MTLIGRDSFGGRGPVTEHDDIETNVLSCVCCVRWRVFRPIRATSTVSSLRTSSRTVTNRNANQRFTLRKRGMCWLWIVEAPVEFTCLHNSQPFHSLCLSYCLSVCLSVFVLLIGWEVRVFCSSFVIGYRDHLQSDSWCVEWDVKR